MEVERSAWGMGEDERQGSRGRVFRRPNWNQVMVAASESQARFAELARRQTAEVTPKSSGFSLLTEATAIVSAVSPGRVEKLGSTAPAPAYSAVQSVAHRSVPAARTQREYGESRHERVNEPAARSERVSPDWRVSNRADVKVTGWEPEVEPAAERYRAAPTWKVGTEPVVGTPRAAIVSARELRHASEDTWYQIEDPFEDTSDDFGYESQGRGQGREARRESNERSGASAMLASGLSRWRSVWDSGVKLAERRIG